MLVENIQKYLDDNDLTVSDFAKKCGIRPTTLFSILRRQTKSPTVEIAEKIAREMGITIDELAKNNKQETDEIKLIYEQIKSLDRIDQARVYAIMQATIKATKEFNEKNQRLAR